MLKIKLTRFGKKKQPIYRIVVAERRSKSHGKYIDLLGTYNISVKPKEIKLDLEKYKQWCNNGAQPTMTVASIFKKATKAQ